MIKIISEIGINHDGDYEKAKKLILLTYQSGAHAVKFQYRNIGNVYAEYIREIGDEILSKEINRNFLSPNQLLNLSDYAKKLGLEVGISFFDTKDIQDFSEGINSFDFFKIPSIELTNKELINTLLTFNKHLYISLGAHDEKEVDNILKIMPKTGWTPMHCISNYPTSIENSRLGYITYLQNKWGIDVGYSSHDDDYEVCLLAMYIGVSVIERHITLSRESDGLDHSSSSTLDHFKKIVRFSESMPSIKAGNSPRIPNQGELLNRQNLGRSFYAIGDFKKGHILRKSDLIYRSPATGLSNNEIQNYIGKQLLTSLNKGDVVSKSLFIENKKIKSDVLNIAKEINLSIPVRLHDYQQIEKMIPINAFEFHLSFDEAMSEIDTTLFGKNNNYSIHLPDYINSTKLMDPFSNDKDQRELSLNIIENTVDFAERLQDLTGDKVLIVGSFSIIHEDKNNFYRSHSGLFKKYLKRSVEIVPQWLPPIAWYFGGSVTLNVMNNIDDIEYIKKYDMNICMDICHLLLGQNYFKFSANSILDELKSKIKHLHIADAAGIDGEGLPIGDGELKNSQLLKKILSFNCLKVIEVWQGHLDNAAGFKEEVVKLTTIK
jgi:sialic acid synthase SpsE/sugar phosphate isomerase/epimerase